MSLKASSFSFSSYPYPSLHVEHIFGRGRLPTPSADTERQRRTLPRLQREPR